MSKKALDSSQGADLEVYQQVGRPRRPKRTRMKRKLEWVVKLKMILIQLFKRRQKRRE